ncbi:MAG: site-specific integrase [Anaerolineae bacterium]|nr:site-specific integrase [Thermoflexales bacterium]MDW8395999.1 site-specific integrase [Anaerolineae bacterium]
MGALGVSLQEAVQAFALHLTRRPLRENTRKAFLGDVRLFVRFLGQDALGRPVATLRAEHIRNFLQHEERRRVANSPKSLERRLTSLKVFFKWLNEAGYIPSNPAEGVPYRPVVEPLPEYLSDAELEAVIAAAEAFAAQARHDTRPLAAILLVAETGIKKSECLKLEVSDVDLGEGIVHVRYVEPSLKFKERSLPISRRCVRAVEAHLERFKPHKRLFECTGRNIEYLFNRRIAPAAGLRALTFEMLRWTCAVREYRAGEQDDEIMQHKYGLSPIGWSEMAAKLARILAAEQAQRHP